MTYNVSKTDEQWRDELSDEQFSVLRQAATERPWTGELLDEGRAGVYTCAACGAELFKSGTKARHMRMAPSWLTRVTS